jgi:hypothetical protein
MNKLYVIILIFFTFQIASARTRSIETSSSMHYKNELWKLTEKQKDFSLSLVLVQDPITLIIKEGIRRVIKAMDLVFQRLQQVQLQIQSSLEYAKNVMSKAKLTEVNELVAEKKEIFDKYYQELWTVKSKIDQVRAIKDAIVTQGIMIENFTKIFSKFSGDSYLNEKELQIIYNIYNGMLEKNVNSISDLTVLIKDFSVKMQDGDRLILIKEKLEEIKDVSGDFNEFTDDVITMSLSRVTEVREINEMKMYYGLE